MLRFSTCSCTADIHQQSTPTDALLDRLGAYDGPEFVVILDEVDQLQDERVLYDLYRTRGISMILIVNQETELFTPLDDRLVSRLDAATRIRFEKYELEELVSILEDRVRWGLDEVAISRDQLVTIADAAAGDTRIAISILRSAARQAEQTDADDIDSAVIHEAIPEGRREVAQKNIEQLTSHQRALYEIICEHDSLAPGSLYEHYRERVEDPKSNRTVRNYLSKLAHYNLITQEGNGRGRTYRLPA